LGPAFTQTCAKELSQHALYLRLKRLCTPSTKGVLNVSEDVHEQWQKGNREELSLALLKALKQYGTQDNAATRKQVRVGFDQNMLQYHAVQSRVIF
jgi:hypothetical protein